MRRGSSHLAVVFSHLIFSMWDVDDGTSASASIFGIGTNDFKTLGIDPSSQGVPEGVLDHARQTVDRVLGQPSFIENDSLSTILPGDSELLKEIGHHVVSLTSAKSMDSVSGLTLISKVLCAFELAVPSAMSLGPESKMEI
jgi:hypothetical protein